MKQAIRSAILMVVVLTTFAAVAAPVTDGQPRPKGFYHGVTAPVHQPSQDGQPRPKGY